MRKVGQPTKYNKSIVGKVKKYIKNHLDLGDIVPTMAGLACELRVNKDTLYEWAKHEDKREYSDTLRLLQQKQERLLLNGGLSGSSNTVITKLMLTNHGYHDKQEVDNKSSDGSMTPTVIKRVIVKSK